MSTPKPLSEIWDELADAAAENESSGLRSFHTGKELFKSGFDAAITELQKRAPKFDLSAAKDYFYQLNLKYRSVHFGVYATEMAIWQYEQCAALLAARDVRIEELETEVIKLNKRIVAAWDAKDEETDKVSVLEAKLKGATE